MNFSLDTSFFNQELATKLPIEDNKGLVIDRLF
jgi:hypothetical protein